MREDPEDLRKVETETKRIVKKIELQNKQEKFRNFTDKNIFSIQNLI